MKNVIKFQLVFLMFISSRLFSQASINYRKYAFMVLISNDNFKYSNEPDRSGTGFILRTRQSYYLVTAAHVLNNVQLDSMRTFVPSFNISYKRMKVSRFNYHKIIFDVSLTDESKKTLLYHFIKISENRALDVAVIKLSKPAKELIKYAINIDSIQLKPTLGRETKVKLVGYPVKLLGDRVNSDTSYEYQTRLIFAKDGLDTDLFFLVHSEPGSAGLSGSPVFTSTLHSKYKLSGVLIASDEVSQDLALVISAKYIKLIIDRIEK